MEAIKVSNGNEVHYVSPDKLDLAKNDGYVPTIKVSNGSDTFDVHPSKLENALKDGFKPVDQETSLMDKEFLGMTPRGLIKGSLNTLPTVGAIAGGALGGAAGLGSPIPGGAIGGGLVGSGLGASGGEALKQIGEKYLLNETPKELPERLKDIGEQGLTASEYEMGIPIAGKAIEGIGSLIRAGKETKPNAEAIAQAVSDLSKGEVKPTPGMLSNAQTVQGMESSLKQSPTLAGYLTRKETQPVENLVRDTGKQIFEEIPKVQPSDVGYEFKQGLRSEVESRVKPISEAFDRVRESTQFIDVNPKSLERVSNNIINSEPFKSSPAYSMANTTAEDLKNVKTVDELKDLRTNVGKRLDNPNLDATEKASLSMMYGKLTNLEHNTIMREAINQARNGTEGAKIGQDLLNELKQAKSDYKGVMTDLGLLGKDTGISKKVNSIEGFLNKIDDIPDEKIIDTFFKPGNRQSLLNLEKLHPEGYESLKQAKLNQIRTDAEIKGELDPGKLLRNIKSMEHDTRVLLFGEENADNLSKMQTIINSLPNKMGPSGTPQGWEFVNIFSLGGLMNEFSRMAQYGSLKMKSPQMGAPQAFKFLNEPIADQVSSQAVSKFKNQAIGRGLNNAYQTGKGLLQP